MKAILVVDVPDDFETKDAIAIVDVQNEKGEGVIAMCPLKPLPQKQIPRIRWTPFDDVGYDCGFIDGYNACLDSIIGENNESNTSD